MKTIRVLFAGVVVGLAWFGLAGCQNADQADEPAAVEKKAPEAKPATTPAAQKPKDHPAH